MRRWRSTGGALALVCVCALVVSVPRPSHAQAPDAASNSGNSKPKPKTASPKTPAKTSAKSSTGSTTHSGTSRHASSRKGGKSKRKTARGQQKIEPERAQAIQEALIRERYLSGTAAGTWNQSSEEAMRRYQADHGWQSKTVPDSRALISLGLGPSHDHLLNPDSAMTMPTATASPRAASLTPVSHSADPGARMNTKPTPPADPAPAATPDPKASRPQ